MLFFFKLPDMWLGQYSSKTIIFEKDEKEPTHTNAQEMFLFSKIF